MINEVDMILSQTLEKCSKISLSSHESGTCFITNLKKYCNEAISSDDIETKIGNISLAYACACALGEYKMLPDSAYALNKVLANLHMARIFAREMRKKSELDNTPMTMAELIDKLWKIERAIDSNNAHGISRISDLRSEIKRRGLAQSKPFTDLGWL